MALRLGPVTTTSRTTRRTVFLRTIPLGEVSEAGASWAESGWTPRTARVIAGMRHARRKGNALIRGTTPGSSDPQREPPGENHPGDWNQGLAGPPSTIVAPFESSAARKLPPSVACRRPWLQPDNPPST